MTNSDPVTGQAAWYDLKVNVYKAEPWETGVYPNFETIKRLPGIADSPTVLHYHTHTAVNLERPVKASSNPGYLSDGDDR